MPEKPEKRTIIIEPVTGGAFYQGLLPGGFTDATTGIHIPGPKVRLDDVTHQIVEVTDLPAPVQLPTHRIGFDLKNPDTKIEVPFDRLDGEAVTDGFTLALSTGCIRECDDDFMQEHYPAEWEARFSHKVWSNENKPVVMADLIKKFENKVAAARSGIKGRATEATERAVAAAPEPSEAPKKKRGRPAKVTVPPPPPEDATE